MRTLTVLAALVTMALPGCTKGPTIPAAAATPAASVATVFPDVIALPNGFWPEGIDFGRGTTFHVGSIATGAIFNGLGATTLPGADRLLLMGRTLYVVQGDLNQVAVVRLAPDEATGVLERTITDPDLDFPSTIAGFGNSLYAVNARFQIPAAPDVEYHVARLPR